MAELKDGCVRAARGPLLPEVEQSETQTPVTKQEVKAMHARVGQEAIDFETNAFIAGEGFKPVKLSDYRGKWIVLCFYPGDFTFV